MHRRKLRGLVRDYVLDAIDDNPEASRDQVQREATERPKEDFGDSSWLKILLQILQLLLPLLLTLKKNTDKA